MPDELDRTHLIDAIVANQAAFGLAFSGGQVEALADFYELVERHNPLLHLVAPTTPEEFAVRHILESLTLAEHLPAGAVLADVGTGGGFPSIPILIVRDGVSAVLIESKLRKAAYLREALTELSLQNRAAVIDRQFEEARGLEFTCVTSRALDRFSEKLPRMIKWAGGKPLFLFGGPSLAEALTRENAAFDARLMPMSEQRFLFSVKGRP